MRERKKPIQGRHKCVKVPEFGKKSKNWKGSRLQWFWRCMYCGRKTKDENI